MAQSLSKVYLHLVFSTKYRENLLMANIQQELYRYMGGICKNLECFPISIGGYTDHIHILCMLSRKVAIMNLLQDIKTGSSKWIKTKGDSFSHFHWQDGYGAFSVNPSQIEVVTKYIEGQAEHHKKQTFQDEYRAF